MPFDGVDPLKANVPVDPGHLAGDVVHKHLTMFIRRWSGETWDRVYELAIAGINPHWSAQLLARIAPPGNAYVAVGGMIVVGVSG